MRSHLLLAAASVTALAAFAGPATAQSGRTLDDMRISDFQKHETERLVGTKASNNYDLAVGHFQRMRPLLDREDLGERDEKKLQKAYEKSVSYLEKAIEAAPEWLDARMMLGAVHYKMKQYGPARTAYESVLALDPGNESAESYLATVNWYLARTGDGEGGANP